MIMRYPSEVHWPLAMHPELTVMYSTTQVKFYNTEKVCHDIQMNNTKKNSVII